MAVSRRKALRGSVAAMGAAVAAIPAMAAVSGEPSPDAELILCAERAIAATAEAADRQEALDDTFGVDDASPEMEAEISRLADLGDELMEQAVLLPATTLEGWAAKVRLLALKTPADLGDGKWRDPDSDWYVTDRLTWSLHHDMRAAPLPPH